MGWNKGYTIFESTVVGAYDLGKLDKKLLRCLMEPYRGTDIDQGGSQGLLSRDGKGVVQIVIETWGLDMPQPPADDAGEEVLEEYEELVWDMMDSITRGHFGWA
ncbi:MAG: hypothetical protein ABIL58_23550 [Pseudomonadota bacterium]